MFNVNIFIYIYIYIWSVINPWLFPVFCCSQSYLNSLKLSYSSTCFFQLLTLWTWKTFINIAQVMVGTILRLGRSLLKGWVWKNLRDDHHECTALLRQPKQFSISILGRQQKSIRSCFLTWLYSWWLFSNPILQNMRFLSNGIGFSQGSGGSG